MAHDIKCHFLNPNKLGLDFIAVGIGIFMFLFIMGDFDALDITIIPVLTGILLILFNSVLKITCKH
jgi:hypothetical protein